MKTHRPQPHNMCHKSENPDPYFLHQVKEGMKIETKISVFKARKQNVTFYPNSINIFHKLVTMLQPIDVLFGGKRTYYSHISPPPVPHKSFRYSGIQPRKICQDRELCQFSYSIKQALEAQIYFYSQRDKPCPLALPHKKC